MDDNPVEANLGFTCRKEGEYLGSDAVENLRKNGVKRKLVTLHVKESVRNCINAFFSRPRCETLIWNLPVFLGKYRCGDWRPCTETATSSDT